MDYKECTNKNGDHFRFMGIPIDGTVEEFSTSLKSKNFQTLKDLGLSDDISILRGRFATFDSSILVINSDEDDFVWKIVVLLCKSESWWEIKEAYMSLKEAFQAKYKSKAVDYSSHAMFLSPYEEGDGSELSAIDSNCCLYSEFYELDNGYIMLKIDHSGENYISLSYEDKINVERLDKIKQKRMLNDI